MESNTPTTDTLRTEKVRWNLARYFYTGIDDPQLNTDVEKLIAMYKDFHESHKDKLAETLPQAIRDWAKMGMLESKIGAYIRRMKSLNVSDSVVKAKDAQIDVRTSKEASEYCEFFVIELAALDDAVCERWYKEDEFVRKHKSWIAHIRLFKQHMLSEEVESATTKFEPFGDSAWDNLHEEFMSDFEIEFRGEKKTFEEILDTLNNSPDAVMRAEALALINKTLGGWFGKFAAETLWMLSGSGAVADEERKYAHPMQAQNMSNRVSDEMVLALHNAVRDVASPIMKRFYKLKANLLGLKVLPWSDRNAAMPFSDSTKIPYDEALKTVLAAYEALSPVLAEKVLRMHEEERVDAPAAKGKADGAYCSSIMLSDGIPRSFLLLNYLGSNRDVMTLAHEAGHGVHGELAGEEQGALMFSAPTAYAETASIFGEMTTFNYLKKRLIESGDKKSLLALLMSVIDDSINSVVRQIGFSNFERRLHGMDETYTTWGKPKKLSAEELDEIWLQTLKELYGEDGEVFTYENAKRLWAYIPHFHWPFYVYGYAFGELLVQSLYAVAPKLGDSFGSHYLDALRSGSTKGVVELLAPFGLDPTNEEFWVNGINVGMGTLLQEAEALSNELGFTV